MTLVRIILTLVLGAIGGWAFFWLHLPLAWMLGPMAICIIGALLRMPLAEPRYLTSPMIAIVGVMLGSGFTPEMFDDAGRFGITIAGLVLFMGVAGVISVIFMHRVAGYDLPTAYFSGMPGGLIEMMVAGEERGGDPRRIVLSHSARIFIVVFALPGVIALMGYNAGASVVAPDMSSLMHTPLTSWIWLIGCVVIGMGLGRLIRMPAPMLVGPMLLSALVHGVGLTDFQPPGELIIVAQIVLGTSVGTRFLGVTPREILQILGYSVGCNGMILAVTLIFAFTVGALSGAGTLPVLLAYSPGGLTEMSLIGLALNVEASFVVFHHILRVVLVMTSASLVFMLLERWLRPKFPPDKE